jgi:hypothetical protein
MHLDRDGWMDDQSRCAHSHSLTPSPSPTPPSFTPLSHSSSVPCVRFALVVCPPARGHTVVCFCICLSHRVLVIVRCALFIRLLPADSSLAQSAAFFILATHPILFDHTCRCVSIDILLCISPAASSRMQISSPSPVHGCHATRAEFVPPRYTIITSSHSTQSISRDRETQLTAKA